MKQITVTLAVTLAAILLATASATAAPRSDDDLALPSADRLAPWIRDQVGDHVNLELRVCIASDGHVTSVGLLHGSAYGPFDDAVLKDVANWRFPATRATSDGRCVDATIHYNASATWTQ